MRSFIEICFVELMLLQSEIIKIMKDGQTHERKDISTRNAQLSFQLKIKSIQLHDLLWLQ